MKNTTVLLAIFISLIFPAIAKAELESFSLAASIDQVNGTAYENVYTDDRKISELIWDIKGLTMGKISLEIPLYERLKLRASYASAINQGSSSGTMIDSDWLGGPGFNDGNTNYDNWTHRSFSTVRITEANIFDANLSYNFLYNFRFNLGYKRNTFKWQDYGGDYIYSVNSFRDTTGNFGGVTGIIYSQKTDIPYVGLELQQPIFNKKVLLTLSGAYSNLVTADGYDQHLLRDLRYRDRFRSGTYYNFGAKIDYFISENLALGFGYEYNEVKEIIGSTDIYNEQDELLSSCKNCAGLSNKYETFSLSLKYLFNISDEFLEIFSL